MFLNQSVGLSIVRGLSVFVLIAFISACSSMSSTARVTADANGRWAILPIANLSVTAQADVQAQTLIETRLRSRGVATIQPYSSVRQVKLSNLLDSNSEMKRSIEWARKAGYRYGITGSVNEWQYKSGADREPAVGISLKLINIRTQEVLWQANAARTGWGYATLSTVADKVIGELLDEVRISAAVQ